MRIFHYLFDETVINILLFLSTSNKENKKLLKLTDFRVELAHTLCSIGIL